MREMVKMEKWKKSLAKECTKCFQHLHPLKNHSLLFPSSSLCTVRSYLNESTLSLAQLSLCFVPERQLEH